MRISCPHFHFINTSDVVLDGAVVVVVLEVEGDEKLMLFTCLLLSVVGPKYKAVYQSWACDVLGWLT